MDWSPQQAEALEAVEQWIQCPNGKQVFYLAGFAGTGKTTLAKFLADSVTGEVLFGAFTGKASLVLRQRGCAGAQTIHQMIYRPKSKSEARAKALEEQLAEENARDMPDTSIIEDIETELKAELENLKRPSFALNLESDAYEAALIVIDEVSMINEEMGRDLESFQRPILVLGDKAQLPPVGGAGYFTGRTPDIELTEIHRQAEGSPIIEMATSVRKAHGLTLGQYGEGCQVVQKGVLSISELAEFDQVLCGKNATRRVINRRIRAEKGFDSHLPMVGDRLICLRNNHDQGLLNGSIWIVLEMDLINDDEIGLTLQDDDGEVVVTTIAHRHYFEDREPSPWEIRTRDSFDFGYAITVHKAQGSQYASVAVVDESYCFRQDAKKHLYTAITRAREKLTVIQ